MNSLARLLREIPHPSGDALESGVDVIGDIAIVRYDPSRDMRTIGKKIIELVKNVSAVYGQEGGIEGEFRLRRLRHLAGEQRTVTVHRENGCQFRLDVARCYFSPRLSTERLRIAEMARDGEQILNMFAGVGVYSVTVAKKRDVHVESCELSKTAFEFHLENNSLNKVATRVNAVNDDAANLPSILKEKFDRILMPLPSNSDKFLGAALALAREGAVIHYYRHVSAENLVEAKGVLDDELAPILPHRSETKVRKVREVGKRYLELAADITLP
ncbi:MAG: class I SAM-dependent methyltransferase family protein [Thaumarchaeota archaeon]|nr:class I SAM-dependent methyltransferase family protein [Nitrososphaerota archaeon]